MGLHGENRGHKKHKTLEEGVEREAHMSDEVGDEDVLLPLLGTGDGRDRIDFGSTHGGSAFSHDREVPIGLEHGDGAGEDIGGQPLPPLACGLGRRSNNIFCLVGHLL